MPKQVDTSTLQAALIGYQSQLTYITEKIREIRLRLGARAATDGGGGFPDPFRAKRVLSAAARKRIADAQKKRWAAFHAQSRTPAKKGAMKKRTLSPEAKAKLAANLAKARATRAAKAKRASA
jgi:hypothetical protein